MSVFYEQINDDDDDELSGCYISERDVKLKKIEISKY